MGYFTETMALFEFKSDLKADMYRKRARELASGTHSKDGRESKEISFGAGNGNSPNRRISAHSMSSKKIRDWGNNSESDRAEFIQSARANKRESIKSNPEYEKQTQDYNKQKSCKESFEEYFDSIIL